MGKNGWNFASLWEAIAEATPGNVALVHDHVSYNWSEWESKSARLAGALLAAGLRAGDTVALCLPNSPEVLESYFGSFKAGLIPVNTNYRYMPEELVYLWDNADAVAVIFDEAFVERVEQARRQLPGVRVWISCGSDTPVADWALAYSSLIDGPATSDHHKSGDDLFFIYTGGTTGRPKGVIWRQDDFFAGLHKVAYSDRTFAEQVEKANAPARPVALSAPPLMHGAGLVYAWGALDEGGSSVTVPGAGFNPEAVIAAIVEHRVTNLGIVGDAFAKPLADALDNLDPPADLSSLRYIFSGGAMWSKENRERLLRFAPDARLVDLLGASEVIGVGRSVSSRDSSSDTGEFKIGNGVYVIDDDGNDITPGSEAVGRIAVAGPASLGYYKDELRTESTFTVRDGIRLRYLGDYASVDLDGRIRFLGRGNLCINSGGEKVFPEEVEEVLKAHPGVLDAAVVGIPDERLGQAVCAVVDCSPDLGDARLIAAVKQRLAGYKAPRTILRHEIVRLPNGKIDYPAVRDWATKSLSDNLV
jgi:acyl-CoA synthetase (AMP-forming)/AMP-acid ligase II